MRCSLALLSLAHLRAGLGWWSAAGHWEGGRHHPCYELQWLPLLLPSPLLDGCALKTPAKRMRRKRRQERRRRRAAAALWLSHQSRKRRGLERMRRRRSEPQEECMLQRMPC